MPKARKKPDVTEKKKPTTRDAASKLKSLTLVLNKGGRPKKNEKHFHEK